jgi:hypothetical protein
MRPSATSFKSTSARGLKLLGLLLGVRAYVEYRAAVEFARASCCSCSCSCGSCACGCDCGCCFWCWCCPCGGTGIVKLVLLVPALERKEASSRVGACDVKQSKASYSCCCCGSRGGAGVVKSACGSVVNSVVNSVVKW